MFETEILNLIKSDPSFSKYEKLFNRLIKNKDNLEPEDVEFLLLRTLKSVVDLKVPDLLKL